MVKERKNRISYDAIIVGASFAGLAVAAQLRGKRTLLIDRKPIGTGQTSACGTLVRTLRALDLEGAVLQAHEQIVVHLPKRTLVYRLDEPFCTFDYAILCNRLWKSSAEFVLATAHRIEDNRVVTNRGEFTGELVVDASGWQAVLGKQIAPSLVRRDRLNFGIETTVAYRDEGLHFWYDPRSLLPMGVTWAFPIGEFSRVGVGSYLGDSHLGPVLDRFLNHLNVERDGLHGGFFPHALREPLAGDVFLVGDAAGQCLALTGEGIRPALYFGTRLGHLLRRVLDGGMTVARARQAYSQFVAAHKPGYDWLCRTQRVLPRLPLPVTEAIMALVNQPIVSRRVLDLYTDVFGLRSEEM